MFFRIFSPLLPPFRDDGFVECSSSRCIQYPHNPCNTSTIKPRRDIFARAAIISTRPSYVIFLSVCSRKRDALSSEFPCAAFDRMSYAYIHRRAYANCVKLVRETDWTGKRMTCECRASKLNFVFSPLHTRRKASTRTKWPNFGLKEGYVLDYMLVRYSCACQ